MYHKIQSVLSKLLINAFIIARDCLNTWLSVILSTQTEEFPKVFVTSQCCHGRSFLVCPKSQIGSQREQLGKK